MMIVRPSPGAVPLRPGLRFSALLGRTSFQCVFTCLHMFAWMASEKGRTNACRPLVCAKVILRGWRGPFLQPGFSHLRTLEDISRTQKALECGPVLQNRVSDCGKTADPMGHRHVKCQGNMSVSVMASMDAQGIRLT